MQGRAKDPEGVTTYPLGPRPRRRVSPSASPGRRSRRGRRSPLSSVRRGRASPRRRGRGRWSCSGCSWLRAFAFLLEVAAACFLRLLSVGVRLGRLREGGVEEVQDRLLADGDFAVVEDKCRDRFCTGRRAERVTVVLLDWRLADQVVDAQL